MGLYSNAFYFLPNYVPPPPPPHPPPTPPAAEPPPPPGNPPPGNGGGTPAAGPAPASTPACNNELIQACNAFIHFGIAIHRKLRVKAQNDSVVDSSAHFFLIELETPLSLHSLHLCVK